MQLVRWNCVVAVDEGKQFQQAGVCAGWMLVSSERLFPNGSGWGVLPSQDKQQTVESNLPGWEAGSPSVSLGCHRNASHSGAWVLGP